MSLHWSPEMLAALRDLRTHQRLPLRDCAERIGVAYDTALNKAHELGIGGRMNRGRTPARLVATPIGSVPAAPAHPLRTAPAGSRAPNAAANPGDRVVSSPDCPVPARAGAGIFCGGDA